MLTPRNDYVLILQRTVGKTKSGIAIPQTSIEGKEFVVVAIGPKVEDLLVGQKVLMTGHLGATYYPVPGNPNLIVMKQEYVVLKEEGEDSVDREREVWRKEVITPGDVGELNL